MSNHTAREEAALDDEARRRAEEIRATEEAAAQAADPDTDLDTATRPSPDAYLAEVHRSGRQHDHSDTAASRRPQPGRRGPRR